MSPRGVHRQRLLSTLLLALLLASILLLAASHVQAKTEWEEGENFTLTPLNPSITLDGYTIEALDFDWYGTVLLRVAHESAVEEAVLYRGTRATFFNKSIRITAEDVSDINRIREEGEPTIGRYPCCPQAKIQVELAKTETTTTGMQFSLNTQWSGRLAEPIKVNITITNTGDASLHDLNLIVSLDSELTPLQRDDLQQSLLIYNTTTHTLLRTWDALYINNTQQTKFQLLQRIPPNKTTYTLTAEITATASNGTPYHGYACRVLTLKPAIRMRKTATRDVILGEYIYPGVRDTFIGQRNTTHIQLIVENQQNYKVTGITITDSLPPGLNTSQPLQWHIEQLKPGERTEIKYTATPTRPSLYLTLPAAKAEWREWGRMKTAASNMPVISVHGPYIIAKKKTQRDNRTLHITVELENIGDQPARINMQDPLPENTTLITGDNTFKGTLRPAEKHQIAYTLTKSTLHLNQTQPIITYTNRAYEGLYEVILIAGTGVQQRSATITRIEKVSATTPAPLVAPTTMGLLQIINSRYPWVEGVLPLILLITAIIVLWALQPKNQE